MDKERLKMIRKPIDKNSGNGIMFVAFTIVLVVAAVAILEILFN